MPDIDGASVTSGVSPERLVAELTELVAARLATHQRPRHITVVEALPRTATGKLQRFILKGSVERA